MEPLRRNLSGGVQAAAADIYMSYVYVYVYISRTYIDAKFDVESDGMVYLASKGHLHQDICEKHAFLNVSLPSTARVSQQPQSCETLGETRGRSMIPLSNKTVFKMAVWQSPELGLMGL